MGINMKKVGEQADNGGEELGPLPKGRYNFEVEKAELTTASTGTEMLELQASVIDGDYKNRKAWPRFPLTEKAMVFLFDFLQATGSDLVDHEDVDKTEIRNDVMGSKFSAYATKEKMPNSDQETNRLSGYKPVDNSADFNYGSNATKTNDEKDIFS